MSTEDLHTSSDPTQSGKVVQLNGDCTSQITLPMSHTVAMWGRVGPAEAKHYIHHTFHNLCLRQNIRVLSMMSQSAMFAEDGMHITFDSLCPSSLLSSCIHLIYGKQSPVSTQLYTHTRPRLES